MEPISDKVMLASMFVWEPEILGKIKSRQSEHPELVKVIEQIDSMPDFRLLEGVLYFQDRLCVPNIKELKNEIMTEAPYIQEVQRCIRIYATIIGGTI